MSTLVTPTFNMPDCEFLAHKLVDEKGFSYLEWFDAVVNASEIAIRSEIDPDGFMDIVENIESPNQLKLILDLFHGHFKEYPYEDNAYNLFIFFVRDSGYKVCEWLECLDVLHGHLVANKRSLGFKGMLLFIREAARNNLKNLGLKDALMEHVNGFDFVD